MGAVARLLIRAEGRVSASSIQRVKEQMDGLIAVEKLEKLDGGYRRSGAMSRQEHSTTALTRCPSARVRAWPRVTRRVDTIVAPPLCPHSQCRLA